LSVILAEGRNNLMAKYLRDGIKKLSEHVFSHVHSLDLLYHKTSTKTTLYAVNKALDSIENSIRFLAGFITPLALEFVLISGLIGGYFGPLYLFNMWTMLAVYTVFTKKYSNKRQTYVKSKFNAGKKSEFFLNESVVNFETVKYFGNENLEKSRYEKIN
jgi:ATP-binding cassette, subfamily B, heavy metal transporter